MKRPYIKPKILFESFALNQHIAACGWDLAFKNANECIAYWDPAMDKTVEDHSGSSLILFSPGRGCSLNPEDKQEFCYTTGAAESDRLFQS